MRFWTLAKNCWPRLGTWESFCGMFEKLSERPDKLGVTEPSELLGKSSVRVWAMFRGTWVSRMEESSWRSSGGREGRRLETSESWVGSVGMEGSLGREMPFSLKNALMLPKHSEV